MYQSLDLLLQGACKHTTHLLVAIFAMIIGEQTSDEHLIHAAEHERNNVALDRYGLLTFLNIQTTSSGKGARSGSCLVGMT